jgi:hypothetical protein
MIDGAARTRKTESQSVNNNNNKEYEYIFCGGIANVQCENGYTCVDDPRDTCSLECEGHADCSGICIVSIIESETCNGFAGFSCEETKGQICVDLNVDSCNVNCGGADCGGSCVQLPLLKDKEEQDTDDTDDTEEDEDEYIMCGGIAGIVCDNNYECIDDPRDECSPECDDADCSGICVLRIDEDSFCGGIANIQCSSKSICIENPFDQCNEHCEENPGADCGGICVVLPNGNDDNNDNNLRECVMKCRQEKKSCRQGQSTSGSSVQDKSKTTTRKRRDDSCKNTFKACIDSC